MIFNCLVVEDEPLAREVMESYIQRIPGLKLVAICSNAVDAHKFTEAGSLDILFLDIQLPEIDGITFLKSVKEKPVTIFTTAFREFALDGFELGVIDYLVKPIEYTRFLEAVTRATDFLKMKELAGSVSSKGNAANSLRVKSGYKYVDLIIDEITHVQGLKDYAIIYTAKEKIVIKGSVKHILQLLPGQEFTRVHKSFLVSNRLIKSVYKGRIEFNDHQIPIGRVYREQVGKLLLQSRRNS